MRYTLLTLLLFFTSLSLHARRKELSDSAEFYLITCSPGEELYSRFGHTAIRVTDSIRGYDLIFNYGVFSFDTENFYYKFVKGETDYMLVGSNKMRQFLFHYKQDGRGISSNKINLNQKEKEKLFRNLIIGCRPENRLYRYNFLFNNCATKVRDVVAKSVSTPIQWDKEGNSQYTYRDLIDLYVPKQSWASFGIYLALGQPCDTIATEAETMFLPDFIQTKFEKAQLVQKTDTLALADESEQLLDITLPIHDSKVSSLWVFLFLFLVLTIFVTMKELTRGRTYQLFDYLLFTILAVGGLILFFIDFISIHPVSNSNFNLCYIHPLYFILVMLMPFKSCSKIVRWFHRLNGFAILLFMIAVIYPGLIFQSFHPGSFILIAVILLRNYVNSKYFKNSRMAFDV